jgi:MFS family permease
MGRMDSPRPGFLRAIGALESRDFRYLYAATFVAAIGGTLQQTANLWQVYDLTGSAVLLGLTGIARALPFIGLSLVGGVIADRVNRRAIIMSGQAANGLVAIGLALLTWTGLVDVWHVYVATFITTSFGALSGPARYAIIPNLVPREQLTNAIALHLSVWQIARIVAPAVAGIGIAALGLTFTYAATGIAFVVTTAMIARIFLGPPPARARESFIGSLVEGLRFIVRRQPVILTMLGTDAAAMLFGSYQILMPILAERLGVGATGYGLLWSADAVGAVLGAFLIASLGDFPYKGYVIVGSILAYCLALVGLALSPWFLLTLLVCGLLGLTDSMQATIRNGITQLLTPDELRGRVSSFHNMMVNGVPSIGQGAMGAAAGVLGPPLALICGAVACAATNVGILARRKELRARDLGSLDATAPSERAETIEPPPVEVTTG